MDFHHISVLLNETIDSLNIKPDGIYVDGTLGGGGHSLEILKRLDKGRLIGLDRDEDAISATFTRLEAHKDKLTIIRTNYSQIKEVLKDLSIDGLDGIVLDLGVSSYQLDTPSRGFSYNADALLDMRMDNRQTKTAKDLVNELDEQELSHILKVYGEERFANRIARNIILKRQKKEIETTFELNEIIKDSIPMKYKMVGGHPSKRTFQAIRIALNDELNGLKEVLPKMIELLKPDGRLCVITFHSLEDRIVKNIFKEAQNPCTCPRNFPVCVCGKKSLGSTTNKPILPSKEEILMNKRSKSAKLRVFKKA